MPGNPADGFESEAMRAAAETWTGEWWTAGGGGTVWDAMAVDEAAGLLYIGTGNGSPWNRDYRSPGGGDNLYLSSIVALDPEDGAMSWHYQTTPGDNWDYTATQSLILLDLNIGGRERQVIVQAPKNGFFYVVDRITGELISAEPFADDLTWATAVDPESGRPVETPEARYGMTGKGVYLAPGPRGAHNWHPMSYSPETGLVYLPATNNYYYFEKVGDYDYQAGRWNAGTELGSSGDRPERPQLKGPANLLLAWDPAENREAWRVPATGGHGGTMTTGGDLVFWGTGTRLAALDARTGLELWSAEVGRGAGSPVSGGGGLASTARDYLRFCRMLLGGGELDGVRLLESETVRLMTRNHLAEELLPVMGIPEMGFGLGFAVPAGEENGAYWWSGVANTYFWIDPAEEIIAFAWTQLQPFGRAPVDRLLRPIVYRAIMNEN